MSIGTCYTRYRIARDGKELGERDEDSIVLALKSGALLTTDYYWDGTQWALLSVLLDTIKTQEKQRAEADSLKAQQEADRKIAEQRTAEAARLAQAQATTVAQQISEANQAAIVKADRKYFVQGLTVLTVLLLGVLILYELRQLSSRQWEYTSVRVLTSQVSDRNGSEALRYSSIDNNKLDELLTHAGLNGWEVVSVALEIETAWPNFGTGDYVTGLQPNIRPQSLLVILRRPKR